MRKATLIVGRLLKGRLELAETVNVVMLPTNYLISKQLLNKSNLNESRLIGVPRWRT
ncbi:MAG: hypothetical protein QXP38_10930 [Nitrososphaerota archaeon]